jgi:hypothetical protein
MADADTPSEEYDDHLAHLARRPHDVLIGWIVVGVLLLGIVLALQEHRSADVEAEASAGPGDAESAPAASVPLAEQIGMSSARAQ